MANAKAAINIQFFILLSLSICFNWLTWTLSNHTTDSSNRKSMALMFRIPCSSNHLRPTSLRTMIFRNESPVSEKGFNSFALFDSSGNAQTDCTYICLSHFIPIVYFGGDFWPASRRKTGIGYVGAMESRRCPAGCPR